VEGSPGDCEDRSSQLRLTFARDLAHYTGFSHEARREFEMQFTWVLFSHDRAAACPVLHVPNFSLRFHPRVLQTIPPINHSHQLTYTIRTVERRPRVAIWNHIGEWSTGNAYEHRLNHSVGRFDFAAMTEVIVSLDQKKFLIHSDLLRARSTFFKARLSQAWDTTKQPITLTDMESSHFNNYLAVVCGSGFAKAMKDSDRVVQLARLWVLADRFGDYKSANIIIDEIIDHVSEAIEWDVFKDMTAGFSHDALLYRLLVDVWLHEGREAKDAMLYDEEASEEGQEARAFLVAIAKAYRKKEIKAEDEATIEDTFRGLVEEQDRAQYHLHDDLWPKTECDQCEA